ncbi:MAG: septum formation protein Maf [Moritella sp.]|uniref:Maf family protein n=1 Tax=Moritella sp. TaxID=78556 RepID=UPI000C121B4A|nr:Maf family protein [Moritella sp.]MBL1417892.1 septum formation inhibitor Maf [Moritella sp.]PHR86435.1 MAG: septum formation protein Maf [Moritella sp.]
MKQINMYLASQSPRRSELLTQIGVEFSVLSVDVEEQQQVGELAPDYVSRLARDKAQAGVAALINAHATQVNMNTAAEYVVLGADTIVVYAGQVLEKPVDEADSIRMLSLLSGHEHEVMTAVAMADSTRCWVELVTTQVQFREISRSEMQDYWRTGEPSDKAGSYAIQGLAGKFVSHLSGSYSAVVGLPLMQTEQLIQAFKAEQNK